MLIKTLFFVIPAHGDVHSAIPVAEELIARGGQATFYLTDSFAPRVRRAGADFRPLNPAVDLYDRLSAGNPLTSIADLGEIIERLAPLVAELFIAGLRAVPAMIDQVRAEKADCIVYNPMCPWGIALARMLDIPAITFTSTFVMKPGSGFEQMFFTTSNAEKLSGTWDAVRRCAEEMHVKHGVPLLRLSDMFSRDEALNIVPMLREFQPDADDLDDRYLFVGPSIRPRGDKLDFPLDRDATRPVLYISLGTAVTRGSGSRFAEICFEAFAGSRWRVILSLGTGTAPQTLGPIPPNFQVRTFVPQLEVLEYADLFITHGGPNSVMEAVWYGVPQVAIPHTVEQLIIADRAAALGVGLRLDPGAVSATVLRDAVDEVAASSAIREKLAVLAAAAKEAGGYPKAADAIAETFRRAQQGLAWSLPAAGNRMEEHDGHIEPSGASLLAARHAEPGTALPRSSG